MLWLRKFDFYVFLRSVLRTFTYLYVQFYVLLRTFTYLYARFTYFNVLLRTFAYLGTQGTLVPRYLGTQVPRYLGTQVPWYQGTLVPRYLVFFPEIAYRGAHRRRAPVSGAGESLNC